MTAYKGSGQIRAKIYAKALLILLQRDRSKICEFSTPNCHDTRLQPGALLLGRAGAACRGTPHPRILYSMEHRAIPTWPPQATALLSCRCAAWRPRGPRYPEDYAMVDTLLYPRELIAERVVFTPADH